MTLTVLHCADLHLAEGEADYSLAVLEEMAQLCRRLRPSVWLLCGDVFNTHRDAQALADAFRMHIQQAEGTPVLMIPGNHELLPDHSLPDLDPRLYAPAELLLGEPWSVHSLAEADAEVVGLPFRRDFSGYLDWTPPPRTRRYRVGMCHGVVNGMSFTGQSEEGEHTVLDPDLFRHLELDYAALGHIHARSGQSFGACLAHYPGSARVWRRGERGPRCASLVTLADGAAQVEALPLAAAGEYHSLTLTVNEAGGLLSGQSPAEALENWARSHGRLDWIDVHLEGFVERRALLLPLRRELETGGAARFRRFEVHDEEVVEAERLRGHPLVAAFNARWLEGRQAAEQAGDEEEVRLLERARQQALGQIHARLEQL